MEENKQTEEQLYEEEQEYTEQKIGKGLKTVNGALGTSVSGKITTDTYWDRNNSPYLVSGTLTIAAGATLTIAPGVVVEMSTSGKVGYFSVYGTLNAYGGNGAITFTSKEDGESIGTTPKYWGSISIQSTGKAALDHVNIRYAAGTAAVYNSGSLSITNSSITVSKGGGIYISVSSTSTVKDVTIQNNTIEVTGTAGVTISSLKNTNFIFHKNQMKGGKKAVQLNLTNYLPVSVSGGLDYNTLNGDVDISGILQEDMILAKRNYQISSTLTIPKEKTLTIQPGCVLMETNATNNTIQVNGTLKAWGMENNPIIFTGINDPDLFGSKTTNYWGGIRVGSTGVLDMSFVTIRNTSSHSVYTNGSLSLTTSKIENSKGCGVYISTSAGDVTVISNDINNSKGVAIYIASLKNGKFRFFGNRTHDSQNDSVLLYLTNYIPASIEGGLYGNSFDKPINIYGTLQMDLSLKKDLYHVGGDLEISAGKTLTIAEGSTLAFLSSSASTVTVGGVLNCIGTAVNPILFTNVNDPELGGKTAGYWEGMIVSKTGIANMTYNNIRYASNTAIVANGELHLKNSSVTNSKSYGVHVNSFAVDKPIQLENNEFRDNAKSGLYLNAIPNGVLTVKNNTISNCSEESITIAFSSLKPSVMNGKLEDNTYDKFVRLTGETYIDFELPKNTYHIYSDLTVGTGHTLTVAPGSIMKDISSTESGIVVNGILNALGTQAQPILFTNYNDPMFGSTKTSYWKGIVINADGRAVLDYADIRYTYTNAVLASGTLFLTNSIIQKCNAIALNISSEFADITIENNKIMEAATYGISINKMRNGIFTFQNNQFEQTGEDTVFINLTYYKPYEIIGGLDKNVMPGGTRMSGTVKKNLSFPKGIYHITSSITIPVNVTLTVAPGSIYRMAKNSIIVNGMIDASGSVAEPIVFTAAKDPLYDGGTVETKWNGFDIEERGIAVLEHVTIRKAGYQSTGSVPHNYYPIECKGKLTMMYSVIEGSETMGIRFNTDYHPVLWNNSFHDIKFSMIINDNASKLTVNASNNYWDSPEGPYVVNSGNITNGGSVSKGVQFIPYLTKGQSSSTELQAEVSYPYEVAADHRAVAKVTAQGNGLNSYYAEIWCSWDKVTWYKKGGETILISSDRTGFTEIEFMLYETGTLYTKAVLYNEKGGTQQLETSIVTTPVDVWYYACVKEKDTVVSNAYISASKGSADLRAIVKREDEDNWNEHKYSSGIWKKSGTTYFRNPVADISFQDTVKQLRPLTIKKEDLMRILDTTKFAYNTVNDTYTAKEDYWNKTISADTLYDNVSQYPGTIVDWQPVIFSYNGSQYLFSMWKGQYYLLAGGEIGLYKLGVNEKVYSPVSNISGMHIKMQWYFGSNSVIEETEGSWLTVYKAGLYFNKKNVSMRIELTFPNGEMCTAFVDALKLLKYTVTITGNTAVFTLTTTVFQQPELEAEPDSIWAAVQKGFYEQYEAYKKESTPVESRTVLTAVQTPNPPEVYEPLVTKIANAAEEISEETPIKNAEFHMKYELNTNARWIYCNYPEHVSDDLFTNDVLCFNRVEIKKSEEGEIFYSYQSPFKDPETNIQIGTLTPYQFVVLIQAKGGDVVFNRLYYGHSDSEENKVNGVGDPWNSVAWLPWKNYFKGDNKKEIYIKNGESDIACYAKVSPVSAYSGNLRYSINIPTGASAVISVYGYRNKGWNELTGTEPIFPYDPSLRPENFRKSQYSGYGDGYFIMADPVEINLSQLKDGTGVQFITNQRANTNYTITREPSIPGFTNEIIPIHIAGSDLIASVGEKEPLANIANWCTHYYIPIKFTNDTNNAINKRIVYEIYQGSNYIIVDPKKEGTNAKIPVIQYINEKTGLQTRHCVVSRVSNDKLRRNLIYIDFASDKSTVNFNYQYMMGTNSTEPVVHIFRFETENDKKRDEEQGKVEDD